MNYQISYRNSWCRNFAFSENDPKFSVRLGPTYRLLHDDRKNSIR
jgi:hypothetical protein